MNTVPAESALGLPVAHPALWICFAISVDWFGPHPVIPNGNPYILLFTDRLAPGANMYAVSAFELTA